MAAVAIALVGCGGGDQSGDNGDSGAPLTDAGAQDDAGALDAGPHDAGVPDSGTPDAGQPDAGIPDAGPPDAGPPDAGTPDAGTPDAGDPFNFQVKWCTGFNINIIATYQGDGGHGCIAGVMFAHNQDGGLRPITSGSTTGNLNLGIQADPSTNFLDYTFQVGNCPPDGGAPATPLPDPFRSETLPQPPEAPCQ